MKRRTWLDDDMDRITDRLSSLLDKYGDPPPPEKPAKGQRCENCGAVVPELQGIDPKGRKVCCIHCIFNPEGCRCRFGEYGVAETDDWT